MVAKLTAEEQNLIKVFSNEYKFDIPFYQRPYAWTTDQVSELLDDLNDAMTRDLAAPYFLGSIVLIKSDGAPESEVVDGQQRLTTLTMLLCVLRELFDDLEDANEMNDHIREPVKRIAGIQGRFRLRLRERDRGFFQDNVQTRGRLRGFVEDKTAVYSDNETRIFENASFLWSNLKSKNEDYRRKIAAFIVNNCFLVVVSASDEESADRIFSVLNARGLDLSPTDKLKPPILSHIQAGYQDDYARRWEILEERLGREDFRDLFAHIRMIHRKDKLRSTLDREFREHILGELTAQKARAFVDVELEPYADVYELLSRSTYASTRDSEMVNSLLRSLNRLDNFDWIPSAMSYFKRNNQFEDVLQFTRDLERLAYGLFIRRANINQRIGRYAQVLSQIEKDGDLFAADSPLQLDGAEKREILSILDGDVYVLTRVRRPLLLRLDSLVADAGAQYDHQVISIEHVLPQNPSDDSEWLEWFSSNEQRELWTHRIANLVLLSRRKNTRASNYEFDRKKNEYFVKGGAAPFALTTQVLRMAEWTPEILEVRQAELVGLLASEWRLS